MTTERARQGLLLSASGADSSMTAGIGGAGETIGHKHGERGIHNRGLIAAMGDDRSESELFQRVRARLRAQVGEDIFNSWFARLELEEIVEDRVHLSVPTRFLSSWIQSNYAEKILEAFKAETPTIVRLHFTVRVNGQARPRLTPVVESVHTEPETPTTTCLLYTSPSPRDRTRSRMPSSA